MKTLFASLATIALITTTASAQAARSNADELATANPIADLISLPLQSNWDKGVGDNTLYTLDVQPVIPFQFNGDWNLITRTIIPVASQPALTRGQGDIWGTGDVVASQSLSPRNSSRLIWGVGPAFLLPTASDDRLGSEKWAGGPTGVVLVQNGPWTYGGLANHLSSFAGNDDRTRVDATIINRLSPTV